MALTKVDSTLVDGAINTTAAGNVGIGTPSLDANTRLQVNGDVAINWGVDKFIGMKFGSGTSYKMGMMLNSNTRECKVWSQSVDSDDKVTFYTGTTPTERMRITSAGEVSISNLAAFSTPEGVFTINGDSCGSYIGAINNRNLSNCNPAHGLIFRAGYNGSASGSNYFSFRRPDNTVTGSITQTGGTTVSFTTSSDYRLKENIVPMSGALDKVALLKPVTYTWKEDGSAGQGFIAHELQEVVPDCVVGEKDAVDAEGKPKYQGIDTSFLVATLTAAIQEQQAIITDLKARIETLEAK